MKIAAICIAKDEDDYIEEWIKYHLKLGFDDIFIYENNWRHSFQAQYKNVHFIAYDGVVMQLKAYNSFIQVFGNSFDWAAFIDVDEFVVNTTKVPFKHIIESKTCPQLALNWRIMGSNNLHEDDTQDKSVLNRFIKGGKSLNRHVKQFVNLKYFRDNKQPYPIFINPHCTNKESTSMLGIKFFGPWQDANLNFVMHDLELYHYAVKTPEELHKKVMRGRADTVQNRIAEEQSYFKEHDQNDIELTYARDFMLS